MWKPGEVLPQHRRRAVTVFGVLVVAIIAYAGWLMYKAVEKTKTPDTSFVLSNVVYKYPDVWICPYVQYGCDTLELEQECVDSAWTTEGGVPDGVFYPREKSNHTHQVATEQLQIEAVPINTYDLRGRCVEFRTSAATAFLGKERDPDEYLNYILLDMYWYPGGESGNSTTCVPDGQEWDSHREWVYAFLADPEDPTTVSTGIQLSYSCITESSNSHIFHQIGIGLTEQNRILADDISSYKAITTNSGVYKDRLDPTISKPYARLSLEIKQKFDSWEIITEASPFAIAEMFGNIGGFWDLLLILWPIFFVAAVQEEPHLKPRNFAKLVVRGAERAAGISHPDPMRRASARGSGLGATTSARSVEDGFREEQPPWEPSALEEV